MLPAVLTHTLILIFGTLCPGLCTYQAFINKRNRDCTAWLKYWIVYAMLMCLQALSDLLFFWLPAYQELKLLFFIWLLKAAPTSSLIVFDNLLHPVLIGKELKFDFMQNEHDAIFLNKLCASVYNGLQWTREMLLPFAAHIMRFKILPWLDAMQKYVSENANVPYNSNLEMYLNQEEMLHMEVELPTAAATAQNLDNKTELASNDMAKNVSKNVLRKKVKKLNRVQKIIDLCESIKSNVELSDSSDNELISGSFTETDFSSL